MSGVRAESDGFPNQPGCSGLSLEFASASAMDQGNAAGFSVYKQISGRDINNINATEVVLKLPAQENYNAVRDEISHISESLAKIYGMEEAWIIPLPFDKELLLNPRDHFVELDMEFLDPSGRFKRGPLTRLSALLDPLPEDEDGPRARHVFIRGDAGFGKSTLCTKIGYDWAKKKTTFPPLPFDNTLLVLFRLRELLERSDPEQVLLEMVHSHSSEPEEDISGTRKLLRKYKGNILLLLDGYDEISKDKQDQVKNSFLKMKPSAGPQSVFRNAVVIMTSRVDADLELLRLFDRHFYLKELSKINAIKLCALYFENLNLFSEGLFLDVKKIIIDMILSDNRLSPIIIILICYICEKEGISVTNGIEDILFRAIFLFAKRCNQRDSYKLENIDVLCKLRKLGRYFFDCIKSEKVLFAEAELKEFFGSDFDFVTKCGVLKKPFYTRKETLLLFEPTHKLFSEALAVSFLNNEFQLLHCDNDKIHFWKYFNEKSTDTFDFCKIDESETAVICYAISLLELPVYLHFSNKECATFRCTDLNTRHLTSITALFLNCGYPECVNLTTLKANILRCLHPGSDLTKYDFMWRDAKRLHMTFGNKFSDVTKNYVLFKDVVTKIVKSSSFSVLNSATLVIDLLVYFHKRVNHDLPVELFLSLNTTLQEGNFENCFINFVIGYSTSGSKAKLYTVKEMLDCTEEISVLIPTADIVGIQARILLDTTSRIVIHNID